MIRDLGHLGEVHRSGKELDFAGGATHRNPVPRNPPDTHLQALMEAPPHTEPAATSIDLALDDLRYELETDIAVLLSDLTATESQIVRLVMMEGRSLRDAERITGISKSEIHRMTQRLRPRLAVILQPIMEKKYGTTEPDT